MSKLILVVLSLFVLGFTSCKKKDEPDPGPQPKTVSFDLTYSSQMQISGSSQPHDQEFAISTPNISTNSAAEFTSHNTSADRVDSAYITNYNLTIKFPTTQTFDLLRWIRSYIESEGSSDFLVQDIDTFMDNGSKVLSFVLPKANFKEAIKKDNIKAKCVIKLDQGPMDNVTIDVDLGFKVYARENQ